MIDVRMLCLAMLTQREATGYDIKKQLEQGSSAGLIEASFGSIYPALARLVEEGFVSFRQADGRGRSGRKIYALTPEGRAHFLASLSGVMDDDRYRSPFLFAALFAEHLPRSVVTGMIDRQLAIWRARIAMMAKVGDAIITPGQHFVLDFGATSLQTSIRYVEDRRHALEAAARPD